jgi:molecular chaperone GrpE (heat shock protein)
MSKEPKKKPARIDVKALENEIEELTEALKRERADAINVRRRSEEERTKLGGFYKTMVVRELLPVIDNFDREVHHRPTLHNSFNNSEAKEK